MNATLCAMLIAGAVNAFGDVNNRLIDVGGYYLNVQEEVDSLELDTLRHAMLFVNGGDLLYFNYLGVEKLKIVLPDDISDQPVDYLEARAFMNEFYDTFPDGNLSRRELRKGNAGLDGYLFYRMQRDHDSTTGRYTIESMDVEELRADVEEFRQWQKDRCIKCENVPVEVMQRAVIDYIVKTRHPIHGEYSIDLYDGIWRENDMRIVVSENPSPFGTFRLYAPNGMVYWDTGEFEIASNDNLFLDGSTDLITTKCEMGQGFVYDPARDLYLRSEVSLSDNLTGFWQHIVEAHSRLPEEDQVDIKKHYRAERREMRERRP